MHEQLQLWPSLLLEKVEHVKGARHLEVCIKSKRDGNDQIVNPVAFVHQIRNNRLNADHLQDDNNNGLPFVPEKSSHLGVDESEA